MNYTVARKTFMRALRNRELTNARRIAGMALGALLGKRR